MMRVLVVDSAVLCQPMNFFGQSLLTLLHEVAAVSGVETPPRSN